MCFLYKGYSLSVSRPRSKRLETALSAVYGQQVVPVLVRLMLTHVREEGETLWRQVIEVDELEERHLYSDMLAEFVLPALDMHDSKNAVVFLDKPTEQYVDPYCLNLMQQMELEFKTTDLELPTKTYKDNLPLRDKPPECGGRIVYLLKDAELHSLKF